MATYIDFQPSDFFNTVLYNGTGSSLVYTLLQCKSYINEPLFTLVVML